MKTIPWAGLVMAVAMAAAASGCTYSGSTWERASVAEATQASREAPSIEASVTPESGNILPTQNAASQDVIEDAIDEEIADDAPSVAAPADPEAGGEFIGPYISKEPVAGAPRMKAVEPASDPSSDVPVSEAYRPATAYPGPHREETAYEAPLNFIDRETPSPSTAYGPAISYSDCGNGRDCR